MSKKSVTYKDTEVIDRLDCFKRNMITLRPDIREIIHEEMSNVVNEVLSKLIKELRKPHPYIERGYRS